MLHQVRDLSQEQKLVVEGLLGRSISGDETVSVKLIPRMAVASGEMTEAERTAALDRFDQYFAHLDAKADKMDPGEEEALLTEAIRSVRPNYRPIE